MGTRQRRHVGTSKFTIFLSRRAEAKGEGGANKMKVKLRNGYRGIGEIGRDRRGDYGGDMWGGGRGGGTSGDSVGDGGGRRDRGNGSVRVRGDPDGNGSHRVPNS